MEHRPRSAWEAMSDEQLALHCAYELGECLEELVKRYDQRIHECARSMSLDRSQAEDLVGEIYLRLVASVPRFEGRSAFGTWLYRLAHNACIDAYRRDSRRTSHLLQTARGPSTSTDEPLADLPASWGDPSVDLDAQIRECYLGQALARLPAGYRQVLQMRFAEGRSNEEVARLLGTSVDSVKAKLQRARRRLKEDLLEPRSCPFCQRLGELRLGQDAEVH
jgi:RNA polymerase sigma-70 factor (ECF subfamily)